MISEIGSQKTPRQDSIVELIRERGPMRYSEIQRSFGNCIQAIQSMVIKGKLIRQPPFYRLPDQKIPEEMIPEKVVYIPPSAAELIKLRMKERNEMRKELEKLRMNLIDIKAFLTEAIKILTPEEYKEEEK